MEQRVKKVLKILEDHGYQAYLVGGYVRDFLLGKVGKDIDIATTATPEEIKTLFKEYSISGDDRFGNVNIDDIQLTTFRKDRYEENRFPLVTYTKKLEEDVMRRDFTINAIYMDQEETIYDFVSGVEDIKKKVIKTIKDPMISTKEDPLRIVRALRFMYTLSFTLDPTLEKAIHKNKILLKDISSSRIEREVKKGSRAGFTMKEYQTLLKKY